MKGENEATWKARLVRFGREDYVGFSMPVNERDALKAKRGELFQVSVRRIE